MEFSPELLALVVGFVLPPVISLLKNPGWPSQLKLALVFIVSLAVGVIGALVDGQLNLSELEWTDPEQALTAATIAFTEATLVYKVWFQSVNWNNTLEGIGTGK